MAIRRRRWWSRRQSQPHLAGLKVRCRSSVASAPERWWAREDLHLQGSQTLDLWGLLFPLNHSPMKLAFPAGLSPATSTFARSRSDTLSYGNTGASGRTPTGNFSLRTAALWSLSYRSKETGASRRCCPGTTSLQRKPAGCCGEAGRSPQCCPGHSGRMKPAGALARLRRWRPATEPKWGPHPELHRADSHTKGAHR